MSQPKDFEPEPVSFARRRLDTVLVVDDCADARETIRDLLEEHGYPVIEAANGQQALNLLVSQSKPRIGLIVLDLRMPVMDGHEFLKILRSYVGLSRIPVLVVSGSTGELDEAERKRIVASLQTPYRAAELLRVVSVHVAR
jgi:CheY-like chemotaxis protein